MTCPSWRSEIKWNGKAEWAAWWLSEERRCFVFDRVSTPPPLKHVFFGLFFSRPSLYLALLCTSLQFIKGDLWTNDLLTFSTVTNRSKVQKTMWPDTIRAASSNKRLQRCSINFYYKNSTISYVAAWRPLEVHPHDRDLKKFALKFCRSRDVCVKTWIGRYLQGCSTTIKAYAWDTSLVS